MSDFTVRSPLDLVVLAPHVMGFHPQESVVLLCLGGPGFHARADLPDDGEEDHPLAAHLCSALTGNGVTSVALLIFSEHRWPAERFATAIGPMLAEAAIDVPAQMWVSRGRFYRLGDPADHGTSYDIASHPLTATRVVQGHRLRSSRAELAAELTPVDPADAAAVELAASGIAERLATSDGRDPARLAAATTWLRERIDTAVDSGAGAAAMETDEVARLLVLLHIGAVRDRAWSDLDRARAAAELPFWSALVARAPDSLVAPAAAVTAFVAWLVGDGALAWCALERASVGGPEAAGHLLAAFVTDRLEKAVPPTTWRPLDRSGGSSVAAS